MTTRRAEPGPAQRSRRGTWAYLLTTLAGCAIAVGVVGGVEPAVGVFGAWGIQAVAFWILDGRLASGRNALKVWVAGLGGRIAGLALAGGLTLVDGVSSDLPLSFGITMICLLLAESAWLARHLGPSRVDHARTRN